MLTLKDIVGHQDSLAALERAIAAGRMHHALLFHGPEGVGKRTTALAVAAALVCRGEDRPEGDACGACPACHKVGKGIHPDVFFITLEKTVIPIDAVRDMRHQASYRPFEADRRVFILDPADRMSHDAQNALLKTLEEPSGASHIILITSRPAHLLPTTRSRCQALPFGTLPPALLAERLSADLGIEPAEALRAARLSSGRYGIAREMDLAQLDALRDEMLELLEAVAGTGPRYPLPERADTLGEDAAEIAERLGVLETLVRDLMLLAAGGEENLLISADKAGDLRRLVETSGEGPGPYVAMMDRLLEARWDLERSVNRKLLAETLLLDMAEAARPGGAPRAVRS